MASKIANSSVASPYERLYGKSLSPEKLSEIRFNLHGFIKTLVDMDRQYKELKSQTKIGDLHTYDNE